MEILKYKYDNESKQLETLADSIHQKYDGVRYFDECVESPHFSHEYVALILWRRSDSESAERGFVFGVKESYEVVSKCCESLKMVSLRSENYSATLWVNENDVIRGFVFCDLPALMAFRSEKDDIE